ncbi:GntR family transcriptional regulator [Ramlibacter sp. PS3R-8]|uniref:GntR family transcriptional regulator n=1 Tax=Ramlibacter sp. PS3R-8 TaxID=3133437 RepID=UPI0030AD79E1
MKSSRTRPLPAPAPAPAKKRAARKPAAAAKPRRTSPPAAPAARGPRKGDLNGNAVTALRDLIVSGGLAPGQRLNERELCEQLAVSRTPVREALKVLTQEGLLQALPNRSPTVAPLDARETAALVEVVAAIESLAGELAAQKVSDAQVAELGILHYTMLAHQARKELGAYFNANKAFHRRIVEYADNPVLLWIWDLLSLRVDRARYASNQWPERWQEATGEHSKLLELFSARDASGVAQAMRAHVRKGLSVVVASLPQPPDSPAK